MSIRVAILKVLASHDSGRATTASLKRDVAILAASGPEWGARMRRLAGRVATIDILASSYALWDGDGWQITSDGRDFLRALEAVTRDNRPAEAGQPEADDAEDTARPPARGADRRRPSIQKPAADAFTGRGVIAARRKE